MIPAAFAYFRAHSADEAAALLAQHGAEARVLAGGQSLVPAMRFRLARPAVLVDINPVKDLDYIHLDGALVIGAITRDAAIERAAWIRDRQWSLLHDVSRVVADPVVRQTATVVGSLCHNDPAGDWTTVALAARADVDVRGKGGIRTVAMDDFLVDSFTTAVGEGELAVAVRFPVPDDRTAGLVPEDRAQGGRLRYSRGRGAGLAQRGRHRAPGRHRPLGRRTARGAR